MNTLEDVRKYFSSSFELSEELTCSLFGSPILSDIL